MYTNLQKPMGKILVTLTVTNRIDQSAAARGFISKEEIRTSTA